jgi:hypothetical protein
MSNVNFDNFNTLVFAKSKLKIEWFNTKGIIKLKNNLLASIEIRTNGVRGHYERYCVNIINKNNVIDSHSFGFDIYLGKNILVIDYCNETFAEWYEKEPEDNKIEIMINKIEHYIKQFETL